MGFTYGTGKGLKEPVSPYREAYFFGAELNEPNADKWNAIPKITQPTTSFNLSAISYGHEVVVALLGVTGAVGGEYHINFKWHRDRDNALLYDFTYDREAAAGGWLYAYSYLGWVDWEINENGDYRVDITVTGAESYSRSITFTVSGIPLEEEELPAAEGFMGRIIEAANSVSTFFYSIYLESLDWVYPFWFVAPFFYSLSSAFNNLAWGFYNFSIWVDDVTTKVDAIPSSADIFFLLWTWLGYAQDAWDWVRDSFWNVWNIVDVWWSSTRDTVLAWVEDAKMYALSLVKDVKRDSASLQEAWDNFKGMLPTIDEVIHWWHNWPGNVLTTVNTWWTGALVEVQGLIDSAFVTREQLWGGWQDWRDKVTEFFSDPEEWLYKAADRIIERFW